MELSSRHRWARKFRSECEANGLAWTEESWARGQGVTRGVLIGRPEARQEDVIVFLHGTGNDALYPQVGLFRHLLQAGWSIATCDLDGHGRGNSSLLDKSELYGCVDDLFRFVERHRPGRERLHLLGYSLGAALLLNYAVHNPERVYSLTMIAMPFVIPDTLPVAIEARSVMRPVFLQSVPDYGPLGIFPAVGPIKRSLYPIRIRDFKSARYLNYTRQLFSELRLQELLLVTTFPALFVGGSQDHIAPLAPIQSLGLPLERLQIYRIEDETHFTSLLSPLCWKRIVIFLRSVRNRF